MVESGCLPLVGLLFVIIGCFLPEEWLITLVFLIIGVIIFVAWIVLSAVTVLKGCTLSELWHGFLDYLAETFVMLIVTIAFFAIIIFFISISGGESIPV